MHFLGIPLHSLSKMVTMIYVFNAGSSRPLGKIRLKCQIGDLRSEMTCYVIDADTLYNMLLGRPWIHANWIVPSTLHQCFKYVDDMDCTVKTVFADTQPFKGVENYFTDAVFYLDTHSTAAEDLPDPDSGEEADGEDDFLLDSSVSNFGNLNCNDDTTVDIDDEWVINENIIFDYSDCVP